MNILFHSSKIFFNFIARYGCGLNHKTLYKSVLFFAFHKLTDYLQYVFFLTKGVNQLQPSDFKQDTQYFNFKHTIRH